MNKYKKSLSAFSTGALSLLFLITSLSFAQEVIAEENYIINGSFEEHGDLNHGSWGTFRSIEGWRANRGFLEVQHNNVSGIGPVDGIAKIELDSYWNSKIYQNLNSLIEGETYRLSLNYSPRTTHRNSNKIRIKWNRDLIAVLNGREQGWTQHTFDVVAKAKNRLKFHAAGRSDSYGGLLDDVTLVCITCDITPPTPTSTVNARITTPSGEVLSDVSIVATSVADGTSTTFSTSTDGNASLILAADQKYVLKLDKTAYATQVVPISSPSENGTANLDFTMIARGPSQTFGEPIEGIFTATGDDGASVAITANSFIDADENYVDTGDIQLTITSVDVSNSASLAAFPGEFSGIQSDGSQTPIISLGTVEYKFTKDGKELQLAEGASAEILIPIYASNYQDGSPIAVGDEIPLWSLTEATGIWLQEGTGFVELKTAGSTDLMVRATVSHFTWWMAARIMIPGTANVTVLGDITGTVSINAVAANCLVDWASSSTITPINGEQNIQITVPANANCTVCISAEITSDTGVISNSNTQCEEFTPNGTLNIDLSPVPEGQLKLLTNGNDVDQIDLNYPINNQPIERVQLSSGTYEEIITFRVATGELPPGLMLNSVSNTQAELSGIATLEGDYTVEIQASTPNGVEIDTVIINFTATDSATTLKPLFAYNDIAYSLFDVFNQDLDRPKDLSPYNIGVEATSWEFVGTADDPVPASLTINSDGIFTASVIEQFTWSGKVVASNASGSVEASITICNQLFGCTLSSSPIPGDYAIVGGLKNVTVEDTSVTLDIVLNQAYDQDITFDFATLNGTALAGVNYIAQTGTVTIEAGQQLVQSITIDLTQNPILEESLSFEVQLSNLSFGRFADDTITINIDGF